LIHQSPAYGAGAPMFNHLNRMAREAIRAGGAIYIA
jgi:hypothetical protein